MSTAVNPYNTFTLVEMAKRMDPSGNTIAIANVLAQDNDILQDAPWQPSNDIWAHKTTRAIKLPSGTWRQINAGVAVEAAKTEVVFEPIGLLETYSEIDVELIKNSPNPAQARMDEARLFLEGLSQTVAKAIVYGSTAGTATSGAEMPLSLCNRMNTLDADGNIIGASGTGSDVTSIYIVQWDPSKVFFVYPKNSAPNVGIQHQDLGEQTVSSATTGRANTAQYQAYRDHFVFRIGLVVRDPRCIARIANIETSGTSNLFDEDDLITVMNRMPKGKKWIYVNDTILTQMEIALKDKSNVNYVAGKGEGLVGEPVMYFRGNPVRLCDQIVNTETAIS